MLSYLAGAVALFLVWQFVDKTIERGKKRSGRKGESESDRREFGSNDKKKGPPKPLPSPYEVLGVSPRMTDDEIATAYKKLVVKNHPDKLQNRPAAEREEAAARLRSINEAYAALKDRPAPRPQR